jgi:hypothetical protein
MRAGQRGKIVDLNVERRQILLFALTAIVPPVNTAAMCTASFFTLLAAERDKISVSSVTKAIR